MLGFDIVLSFLIDSLCISLTSPATLEHLMLNITFRGEPWGLDNSQIYDNLRDAEAWSHLDSITTSSNWFTVTTS
jgi:hypothetical protein